MDAYKRARQEQDALEVTVARFALTPYTSYDLWFTKWNTMACVCVCVCVCAFVCVCGSRSGYRHKNSGTSELLFQMSGVTCSAFLFTALQMVLLLKLHGSKVVCVCVCVFVGVCVCECV